MKEITTDAKIENIEVVTNFINNELDVIGCLKKAKAEIDIAVDELFSNIANYAYCPKTGKATVKFDYDKNDNSVYITFVDEGKPYNPIAAEDPNVTAPIAERKIGGLGILIVKKTMDDVNYKYENNKNILIIKKKLSGG